MMYSRSPSTCHTQASCKIAAMTGRLQDIRLGLYEKGIPLSLDWAEKFKIAKKSGFDFIEFSIDGLEPRIRRLEWSDRKLEEIRSIAGSHGMPFQTMALTANRYYPLGDSDLSVRTKGKSIVKRAIDMAVVLGITTIQIASYDVNGKESTPLTQELFGESILELSDDAASSGVTLAIEVLEDVPHLSTIKQGADFVSAISHPHLKLYADIGNVASIGVEPAQDLACGRGFIAACHVKDALPGNCRNVPFGTGVVDFGKCMQVFRDMHYKGVFVAEVWSDEEMGFLPYLKEISLFIRNYMK